MTTYYVSERLLRPMYLHAGSKARDDVDDIFKAMGFCELFFEKPVRERRGNVNLLTKLVGHIIARNEWSKLLSSIAGGDQVILQFPPTNHSLFLSGVLKKAKKRGIQLVYLIHDLDCLRYGVTGNTKARLWRIQREEIGLLSLADAVIVHNERMKSELVELGLMDGVHIESLGIFDYLVSDSEGTWANVGWEKPIVVAGNLDSNKAGYAYQLPSDMDFNIYGPNYDEVSIVNDRTKYQGSYPADELIGRLQGSFGLVWDGNSTDTCSGSFGQYLRINNPHKTSLYLASGMPVLVWCQAAIADFVKCEGVGMCISSLHCLHDTVSSMSVTEYEEMVIRARAVGRKLREGYFTKTAVLRALDAIAHHSSLNNYSDGDIDA